MRKITWIEYVLSIGGVNHWVCNNEELYDIAELHLNDYPVAMFTGSTASMPPQSQIPHKVGRTVTVKSEITSIYDTNEYVNSIIKCIRKCEWPDGELKLYRYGEDDTLKLAATDDELRYHRGN